jgi:hypothetical protein
MASRSTNREQRGRVAPALTVVAVLAIALAVPASAAATKVNFKRWIATTSDGKTHKVKPGHKFRHCKTVHRIKAKGNYKEATPGNTYNDIWSLNGDQIVSSSHTWPHDHGPFGVSLFKSSGSALPDGKYQLKITEGSTTVGKTSVKLVTPSSC